MQLSLRAKKQHQLLGHVLIKTHPDLAQQLLDMYTTDEIVVTDHNQMQQFFIAFMNSAESFAGSRAIAHRIFIGAMILCYQPELFLQPREAMMVKRGFVKHLSQVLRQKRPNVSAMIRQVIIWQKSYDEIRERVSSFSSHIITQYGQSQTKENHGPAAG